MLALLVAQNIAFYVIAALIVFGAIRVVTCRNLVHAALWLVLVLAGVAAQYILLAAEFVAITQVLVYLGAIVVLFLFGIMLTRAQHRRRRAHGQPAGGPSARPPCWGWCWPGSWATPSGTPSGAASSATWRCSAPPR